jgi:hypothetical protein
MVTELDKRIKEVYAAFRAQGIYISQADAQRIIAKSINISDVTMIQMIQPKNNKKKNVFFRLKL